MQFPKLGISLRSLKRDGSDFSERVNEVSNYNPFSIELMGFAQDLIFNGNLNKQRIDILNQELERFSGKKTFHGPMVVNFLDKKDNLKDSDIRIITNIKDNIPKLIEYINKQNLNEYIKTVVNFSFEANKYFNDSEPWSYKTKDPGRMYAILYTIVEQIKNISILLNPIIPIATKKVLNTINISDKDILLDNIKKNNILDCNSELKSLEILFKKIENDN